MKIPGAMTVVLTVALVAAGAADRAAAAATDIGAVGEIRDAMPPSPIAAGGNAVQIAEATGTYAVPSGYGTLTSWRHSAGGVAGTLTFKVYRPTGPLREFLVVAADTRAVTAGTVQSFGVQIPVRPGDRIGLTSDNVLLAFETFNVGDKLGFFEPDPPLGATKATDGEPFEEFKLNVAATLESDPEAQGGGSRPPGGAATTPSPSAGPPPGSLLSATLPPPPAVTRLRVAPSAFAAAGSGGSITRRRQTGTRVSYSLKDRAAVRFEVRQSRAGRRAGSGKSAHCVPATKSNRRAAKCTRTVTLAGGFTQTAKKGENTFRFTGRLRGRRLKPGAYTLVATPRVGRKTGRSATRRFRITRVRAGTRTG